MGLGWNRLPPPVVAAGAWLDRLAQPRRELHRSDYVLAEARTDADLVWSKALAGGVADICPFVSPGSPVPKPRPMGVLWASSYIDAVNRAAGEAVSVYVNAEHLAEFVGRVLPSLRKRIVLVLGDSVLSSPDEALTGCAAAMDFPDGDRVVACFAQNLAGLHPRAFPFPLGLDFHTVHRGYVTWGLPAGQTPQAQEEELLRLRRLAPYWNDRACEVIVALTVDANPEVRTACIDSLRGLEACRFYPDPIPRDELWREMARCRFVASPLGRGHDTHRTWEALALGAVPIVNRVPAMSPLFERLPVWEVDDYGEVTASALAEKSREIGEGLARGAYDFDRLTVRWWREHVRATTRRLAAEPASG